MTREEAIKVLSSYDVNGVWADVDGKPYNAEEQAEAFDMAIESLKADTAEVVRCKDCRHAYYADNRVPHDRTWVCERFMNEEINANDFCSFGERSEDE